MRFKCLFITILTATVTASAAPPATHRGDVVDTMHGVDVPDPYRWLEDDVRVSQDVSDWVDLQNIHTRAHLDQIETRAGIRERLENLWDYEKTSVPVKYGPHWIYTHNDGLQNQSVWYVTEDLSKEPRVLLDPNSLSEDGTVAVSGANISDDGKWMAWAQSEGGSDWKTWRVRDVRTGKDLPDIVSWSKFSPAAWLKDGSGFYYARYEAPAEGQAMQEANTHQTLWFHRRGTPQSEDVLIHQNPEEPNWGWSPRVSDDGRWLVVHVWRGGQENRVLVQDLSETGSALKPLIDHFEDSWSFVGNVGDQLFFKTTMKAPLGRVVSTELNGPGPHQWADVIPESQDTLRGVSHVGGHLAATWMHDASSRITIHDMQGKQVREIALPGIGTASGLAGWPNENEAFYSFRSFTTPPSIYRIGVEDGQSTLWWSADVDFNPSDYMVSQIFYESRDGTKVPMFLAHRRDVIPNGNVPTLLYGYGGFNIPLTPAFSPSRLAWMEMGGLMAVANLRGGGEYGRHWHQSGTKQKKQNVFDDFIAAAEWLIQHHWTNPAKLAIQGGSNGGLLVGAVMTQRPELFGACLPDVGVLDMLRYHKFTIGRAWIPDYGDPADPDEFSALIDYSPYHNLKPGTRYPTTMITTADTDDRVVPGHSFKYAAALQHAQDPEGPPILIRIDRKAGHGAGKPTSMRIDQVADTWAFLTEALDMQPLTPLEQANAPTDQAEATQSHRSNP